MYPERSSTLHEVTAGREGCRLISTSVGRTWTKRRTAVGRHAGAEGLRPRGPLAPHRAGRRGAGVRGGEASDHVGSCMTRVCAARFFAGPTSFLPSANQTGADRGKFLRRGVAFPAVMAVGSVDVPTAWHGMRSDGCEAATCGRSRRLIRPQKTYQIIRS